MELLNFALTLVHFQNEGDSVVLTSIEDESCANRIAGGFQIPQCDSLAISADSSIATKVKEDDVHTAVLSYPLEMLLSVDFAVNYKEYCPFGIAPEGLIRYDKS